MVLHDLLFVGVIEIDGLVCIFLFSCFMYFSSCFQVFFFSLLPSDFFVYFYLFFSFFSLFSGPYILFFIYFQGGL